jgi:monothiol glutaredoxin
MTMSDLDSVALRDYLTRERSRHPPRPKGMHMSDINALIDEQVKNNDVFLYMKGTPDFPMCGFSGRVVQILGYLGVDYQSANVLENQDLREGIKAYANWPTIPQLYIKGEFVGGADIVTEMFQAGELQSHLADKGIAVKQTA